MLSSSVHWSCSSLSSSLMLVDSFLLVESLSVVDSFFSLRMDSFEHVYSQGVMSMFEWSNAIEVSLLMMTMNDSFEQMSENWFSWLMNDYSLKPIASVDSCTLISLFSSLMEQMM